LSDPRWKETSLIAGREKLPVVESLSSPSMYTLTAEGLQEKAA
jgi:hypothetical protein